ncbi:hypothetical protein [Hominenteromicrobium sp.]|uniref:hypothetical protein n=1 Tax=Hominenteromicrobium sp. TaxID=3073581 RepID=UPI003AB256A8
MRVQNFKETKDDFLVATYFRFGRYLLICSIYTNKRQSKLWGAMENLQAILWRNCRGQRNFSEISACRRFHTTLCRPG